MTVPVAVRLQLRQVGRDGAPFSSVGLCRLVWAGIVECCLWSFNVRLNVPVTSVQQIPSDQQPKPAWVCEVSEDERPNISSGPRALVERFNR
jgi:hypothetical protein